MLGVVNMFFILPTCTARGNKVALRQENLPCSCLFFFFKKSLLSAEKLYLSNNPFLKIQSTFILDKI